MSTLGELAALHTCMTVKDPAARYGLAPGCTACKEPGWPCVSRVLIDRLIEEEASDG